MGTYIRRMQDIGNGNLHRMQDIGNGNLHRVGYREWEPT